MREILNMVHENAYEMHMKCIYMTPEDICNLIPRVCCIGTSDGGMVSTDANRCHLMTSGL